MGDRVRRPAAAHTPTPRADRASVLLLFPAALLVVLVLGAIAVDAAAVFVRQRELLDAAAAAADDGAAAGLDEAHLRATGEIRLDPDRVGEAVRASLSARGVLDELVAPPRWRLVGDQRVEVELHGWADHVLAPVVPGAPDGRAVRVLATARAVILDTS